MTRTRFAVATSVFILATDFRVGATPMPIAPYVPRNEDEDREAPDIGDVVERIIDGGGGPFPVVVPA